MTLSFFLMRLAPGGPFDGERSLPPQIEASLRAADLVICQTGCLSHDACWRVQDHCRRTGKPCVMVGEPQPIHFVRRETAEEAAAERALPAG